MELPFSAGRFGFPGESVADWRGGMPAGGGALHQPPAGAFGVAFAEGDAGGVAAEGVAEALFQGGDFCGGVVGVFSGLDEDGGFDPLVVEGEPGFVEAGDVVFEDGAGAGGLFVGDGGAVVEGPSVAGEALSGEGSAGVGQAGEEDAGERGEAGDEGEGDEGGRGRGRGACEADDAGVRGAPGRGGEGGVFRVARGRGPGGGWVLRIIGGGGALRCRGMAIGRGAFVAPTGAAWRVARLCGVFAGVCGDPARRAGALRGGDADCVRGVEVVAGGHGVGSLLAPGLGAFCVA